MTNLKDDVKMKLIVFLIDVCVTVMKDACGVIKKETNSREMRVNKSMEDPFVSFTLTPDAYI